MNLITKTENIVSGYFNISYTYTAKGNSDDIQATLDTCTFSIKKDDALVSDARYISKNLTISFRIELLAKTEMEQLVSDVYDLIDSLNKQYPQPPVINNNNNN